MSGSDRSAGNSRTLSECVTGISSPSPDCGTGGKARTRGVIESCTILTTVANAVLAPVHDRMPVILPPTEYARWLDPALRDTDSLAPLLVPFPPEGMLALPVNPGSIAPPSTTRIASLLFRSPPLSDRTTREDRPPKRNRPLSTKRLIEALGGRTDVESM